MVLGKLPVCPTNLDYSRARPTALTVGAGGGGCLDIFSRLAFFFLPLSLGDGSVATEILSQRPVEPLTINQLSVTKSYPLCHTKNMKKNTKN